MDKRFNDDVQIVAKDAKQFEQLRKMRDALPEATCAYATTIKQGGLISKATLVIDMSKNHKDVNIVLPPGVTQIGNFNNYIGVYCGDYFIEIINVKEHPSYEFTL